MLISTLKIKTWILVNGTEHPQHFQLIAFDSIIVNTDSRMLLSQIYAPAWAEVCLESSQKLSILS